MFALNGIVYALTAPVWGWLCDNKSNSLTLSLLGCSINIFSLLLIGPAPFIKNEPTIWIIIISLILMGLGLGAKLVCAFTGCLQDTINRGLPPDLSTYGLVSSMIASSQSLGAFVGPSIGGYLLETLGYQRSSMTLLVLETFLIIFLIVSVANRKNWIKSVQVTKSEKPEKCSKKKSAYKPNDVDLEKASEKPQLNKKQEKDDTRK
ncbi:MFS-type transporter SLC18B1 [Trichonephila clavipes]|nr:MFS-type transporter SLC18B1 [Trichonephila clavipes]